MLTYLFNCIQFIHFSSTFDFPFPLFFLIKKKCLIISLTHKFNFKTNGQIARHCLF